MSARRWVDAEDAASSESVCDNDAYLVRLSDQSVVWAICIKDSKRTVFLLSDGDESLSSDPIRNVEAVLVSGYGPGAAERVIAESVGQHAAYAAEVTASAARLRSAIGSFVAEHTEKRTA